MRGNTIIFLENINDTDCEIPGFKKNTCVKKKNHYSYQFDYKLFTIFQLIDFIFPYSRSHSNRDLKTRKNSSAPTTIQILSRNPISILIQNTIVPKRTIIIPATTTTSNPHLIIM